MNEMDEEEEAAVGQRHPVAFNHCPVPEQRQFSQGDISRTYQDSLDPDFFQSLEGPLVLKM